MIELEVQLAILNALIAIEDFLEQLDKFILDITSARNTLTIMREGIERKRSFNF